MAMAETPNSQNRLLYDLVHMIDKHDVSLRDVAQTLKQLSEYYGAVAANADLMKAFENRLEGLGKLYDRPEVWPNNVRRSTEPVLQDRS